jgi:4-hydroxybenzoate polyprenyltransferase/phosphoserine phosphatase
MAQGQTPTEAKAVDNVPLVVDLDGTLIRTDLLLESALRLFKQKPWTALAMPFWLLRGRAYLKQRLYQLGRINLSLLPFNKDVLDWLREEKADGRRLILATASSQQQARLLVEPLKLFDDVLGSDGVENLKGEKKLAAVVSRLGKNFDYAGDSSADLVIWRECRKAVLVEPGKSLEREAQRSGNVARVFRSSSGGIQEGIQAMRLYQWVKNVLVFMPAVTSHTIFNPSVIAPLAIAFLAFGFCASGVYILNDLLDLEEDRQHAAKKDRPFASGRLSIGAGIGIALGCFVASGLVAMLAGGRLPAILAAYFVLTSLYSIALKKILLIDVLTLASLYTLRVIAGHVVTGIPFSFWLLSFAFFLFLSLAFSKRAAELIQIQESSLGSAPGRGYVTADLQAISMAGMCSGFLAALVFALYINSDAVQKLYRSPAILWGLLPVLLYYIVRVWIVCWRGELTDDPIVYTAKAPSTYGTAAVAVLILLAATFDLHSWGL